MVACNIHGTFFLQTIHSDKANVWFIFLLFSDFYQLQNYCHKRFIDLVPLVKIRDDWLRLVVADKYDTFL